MKGRIRIRASALVTFLLVALFSAPSVAYGQATANIQGTVTDSATRRPIVGAQVALVGTSRGTVTDDEGRFALRGISAGQHTVRVVRLGYGQMERRLSVGTGETVAADFALRPIATVLSEVVVTGYGTASRAEVSSAVTQVTGEAIAGTPIAGVDGALQGKAPGVQVIQNAGNPGNGITVRIRGSASLSASNQPLYVVDGIPIVSDDPAQIGYGGQDLTAVTGISPDEIETIDILKDAAAGAIYGSRASNGVVQITTKRGRPGKTRFSFSTHYGGQTVSKKVQLLNATEYITFFNEAAENDGYGTNALFTPGVDDAIDTDWQDVIQRKGLDAPVADYALTVNGGTERLAYMLGGSYFDQTGLIFGSGYNRGNTRLNVDFSATEKLSFRSSLGLARERWDRIVNDNTIYGPGTNSLAVEPYIPPVRADGNYTDYSTEGLEYANPFAVSREWKAPATSYRAIGGVDVMFDATNRLRLTGRLGADINSFRERDWESPRAPDTFAASVNGVARQGTNLTSRYVTEGFATFEALRSGDQRLSVTGGGSAEFNYRERTYVEGEGFGSNFTQYPGSAGRITDGDGDATAYNLVSGFARANYALMDRYLFTASFRADGSSRFGQNNRYGFFPSASFGWNMTDESFMAPLKRVADVKFRASYGVTGNQGIPSNFAYLGTFVKANFAGEPGLAPGNFENPNLKWESTREVDIGFDFSFLNGRVALIADWYRKTTDDLLITRPVTSTSGYTSVWDNVGSIQNQGIEFHLTATPVQAATRGAFEWTTDFNISQNDNVVKKLYNGEPFNSGIRSVNRVEEGVPLGAFHLIPFVGVDPATGDAQFRDRNGNIVDRLGVTAEDRRIVGSPHPDYWGGMRNNLSFRGFDLNTFVEFSQGAEIANLVRVFADDGGYYEDNKYKEVLKRWRQPGDITNMPRASWDGVSGARVISSRFIEDASYVRLQEVTLGYALPGFIAARGGFSNARLYVSGRNLKVWTDVLGYDPDVNSNGSGVNVSLGTEFYAYPRARTISVGFTGNW